MLPDQSGALFFGQVPGGDFQRRLLDEAFSLRLKAEQGLDFSPHLVIVGAGLLQISLTLSGFKLLNGAIMLSDFLIAFRCHKNSGEWGGGSGGWDWQGIS